MSKILNATALSFIISVSGFAVYAADCPGEDLLGPVELFKLSEPNTTHMIEFEGRNFKMSPTDRTTLSAYFKSVDYTDKINVSETFDQKGETQKLPATGKVQLNCLYEGTVWVATDKGNDLGPQPVKFLLRNYTNNR